MRVDPVPAEVTFGHITARHLGGEDVVLIRRGGPGRGSSRLNHLWTLEQIQESLRSARRRPGSEARDEAQALVWALDRARRAPGKHGRTGA